MVVCPLYIGEWSGWHSLRRRPKPQESIEVEARTLDSVLAETGDPHVDVLKIDVEGAELALLRGAEHTLGDRRLFAVLVEVHPDFGVDTAEVCDLLAGYGFTFRVPGEIDVELSDPLERPEEVVAIRDPGRS